MTHTCIPFSALRQWQWPKWQIIRLINKHEPKATALVFKTGKVVVTGSKSNASVDYACKTFARILGKLDNGSGGQTPNINFK